jgi:small nuclear ribonucleoprotein (snRNP)-like protein
MLPLSLLRTAAGHPMVRRARTLPLEPKRVWPQILIFFHFFVNLCVSMQLVELKNGETYNGELVACDNWMNIRCTHVHTSRKLPRQRSAHRRLRPTLPHVYI